MSDYVINPVEIGSRIRDLRIKKGKSQTYYADLFYISPSYLALIEAGKRVPNLEILVQIAKVCGVSLDYLVFGEDTDSKKGMNTFLRLAALYPENDIEKALKMAEYFLQLVCLR